MEIARGLGAAFNKVVRDIISKRQYAHKSELISDVQGAMDCLGYGDEEIESAYKFLDHVINGMRHEIAAEIALKKNQGSAGCSCDWY